MKCLTIFSLLATVLTLALASKHHHEDDHTSYQFEYGVEDHHTGDIKSQHEFRHGKHVAGVYTLKEADGTTRIVKYEAGPHTGFKAEVERIGEPHHHEHHGGGGKHAALTEEVSELEGHGNGASSAGMNSHQESKQIDGHQSEDSTGFGKQQQDSGSFAGFGGQHDSGSGHYASFGAHQGPESSQFGGQDVTLKSFNGFNHFGNSAGAFSGHHAFKSADVQYGGHGGSSGFGGNHNENIKNSGYEPINNGNGYKETADVEEFGKAAHGNFKENSRSGYVGTNHFSFKH